MNTSLPENVQRYLSGYGSAVWNLEIKGKERYDCAVIIPVISEYENIITVLNSLSENIFNKNYKVIIIFRN